MDLDKHYEEMTEALLHAYRSESQLKQLVRFGLNEDLEQMISRGSLKDQVFDLISWADSEGKVDELFAEALERKSRNPKLVQLAQKLANETEAKHSELVERIRPYHTDSLENPDATKVRGILSEYSTSRSLEALIANTTSMRSGQQVSDWRTLMHQAERRVCSIGGKRLGTGFLIAADLVMTNSHVVTSEDDLSNFNVVFDYKNDADRDTLCKYAIVEELARSEPKEKDYVILRLDAVPEGERGNFLLSQQELEVRDPICILGHPGGDPLSFSFGVIFDRNSFMQRIAYTASTLGGSSGSPVFTEDWELVAIHHHGEEGVNNHGIPMKFIIEDLNRLNKSNLVTAV